MSNFSGEIERLRSHVKELQVTLDNIGAYVYTKDLCGRYTFANKLVCELFNRPLTEIIGHVDEEFFDIDKSDELYKYDRSVLEKGVRMEGEETSYVRSTGEARTYWVVKTPLYNAKGEISGMCGISTDITERRKSENELRELNMLLTSILNNAPSLIYMKDLNGCYSYVNYNFTKFFGLKLADIIGKKDDGFMPSEISAHITMTDRDVLSSGKKASSEEILYGANGLASYYWDTKIPLIANGKPYAIVGIAYDITDLTLLRRQLEDQNEELSSLLEQKNLFLGTVIHDLRNPIGAILGISEIMTEKVNDDLKELPRLISDVSSGMLNLVNNLLDASEIESGKLTLHKNNTEYISFIRQTILVNEYIANKKDIRIEQDLRVDSQQVNIDKGKIEQVINNLLSNAIKYSNKGTTITVSVFSENASLVTKVSDEGQGIPESEIGNIFRYFHRTGNQPTGNEKSHGLGLAIAKKIIEGHDGEISVESEVGKGSVFQFRLPV